ncbi:unnamed protein product [Plutella xylostella]|uniref:Palmitoyltransferase n=1 Tax=Plutella xylostella TaxID=51655 RepID=A0A8S4E3K2_PLUXY|nr:unnamed protein product [Plutella xylostella]
MGFKDLLKCGWCKSWKKMDSDTILPFILLPVLLIISTISEIVTYVVMGAIGMGVLYVYSRPQQKNRSLFFFYWTISSCLYMYLILIFEIISVFLTLLENVVVLVLILCTLYFFVKMKKVADFELAMGSSKGKEYCPMITSDSKYCHICQIEVNERFFHSIWWNCCIFRPNYVYFLAGNIFALASLMTSTLYGLSEVCGGKMILMDKIIIPVDCSSVYMNGFQSSLTYVTCVYAAGYACSIAFVLLRQLVLFVPKYTEPQWRRLKNTLDV